MSTPAEKQVLKGVIREISDSMTRQRAEQELVREILKEKSKELNLKPAQIRKLAKVYYKQSFSKESQESEEFKELYEQTFGSQE